MNRQVCLVFAAIWLLAAAALADHAAILDTKGKSVALVDLDSGAVTKRATFDGEPHDLVGSPDGSRLIVFFRGTGEEVKSGWRPTGEALAQVVDANSLEKLGPALQLGFDLKEAVFLKDGRTAIVLSPGFNSPTASWAKSGQLIAIDLRNGAITKRLTLDRPARQLGMTADGTSAILFLQADEREKRGKAAVRFFDAVTLEQQANVVIDGNPIFLPVAIEGTDYLYVVDQSSKGSELLHVVSTRQRSVVNTIAVGTNATPAGVEPQSKRLFVKSWGMPGVKKKTGLLHVIEGKELVKSIDVGAVPIMLRFSDDRKRAYVIGTTFAEIDLSSLSVTAETKLYRGLMTMHFAHAMAEGLSGRRALVLLRDTADHGIAMTIDLEKDVKMVDFTTGSSGERWGKALAAGLLSAGSYIGARSAAQSSGQSVFYYNVYVPRASKAARGPLALSSSGTHAYAIDNMTDDVTIIDLETGKRVIDIDAGKAAQELLTLGDKKTLLAVSDTQLTLIDTQTNKMAKQIPLKGDLADVQLSRGGKRIVVTSKGEVTILDGTNGDVVSRVTGFEKPTAVIMAP